MTTLKVITLFSGYDSQCLALDRLAETFPQFSYDLIAWSEIDRFAIQAHNAIYPRWADRNLGDVCKINWRGQLTDCDLMTYSFPCTDISLAGQQKGLARGSGTRSSLLWECERAIRTARPKYLIMENVKALTQKKFSSQLAEWKAFLSSQGYTNHTQVLNATDYGIAQNRERCFMVSILGDNESYEFPQPFTLQTRLRDYLEPWVDESYYLSDRQVKSILDHCDRKIAEGCGFKPDFQTPDGIAGTITSKYEQRQTDTFLQIPIEEDLAIIRYGHGYYGGKIAPADICPTITTSAWEHNNFLAERTPKIYEGRPCRWRVRQLTPRECLRLMDVPERAIDAIQGAGISKRQQCKMAGNSIVTSCLFHILDNLLINRTTKPAQRWTQPTLFNNIDFQPKQTYITI